MHSFGKHDQSNRRQRKNREVYKKSMVNRKHKLCLSDDKSKYITDHNNVLNPKPEPSSTKIWQHWQNHKCPEVTMGNFNLLL